MLKIVFLAVAVVAADAQTQIDLRTQAKSIDFTAANSTKPFKAGTALPATCAVGELFFNTAATAGANLYACAAANTWSAQGGISSDNCWIDTSNNVLKCRDTSGNVYSVVKTSVAGTANQWVDYIDPTGAPHTSQPTAGAVGAVADPGANGIPYRNGTGTAVQATADNLSGPFFCQDAGSSGAYACNLTPPITAYQTGTTYWFKANTINTGAATINFNSLAPKRIVKQANQDLAAGDVKAGQWVLVTYDGTNMQMQSQTGNAASSGVSTVFGRSGAVAAQSGDYTTAQILESGNLYFTSARTWAALSASAPITFSSGTGTFNCPTCITSATSADTDLYGSFPHLSVVRLQGRPIASTPPADLQYLGWNAVAGQWEPKTTPNALVTSAFGRTGAILAAAGDYSTALVTESTNLYFTNARVWAALSGGGPITFGGSGTINCPTCITSATSADTDLSGYFPHLSVAAIQGRRVASTAPADLQYLGWNVSANQWEPKTAPTAALTSVFGRTGAITSQSGDYSFAQITGTASASQLPLVAMRTDQNNTIATGTTQDFSKAAHTLPMKSGILSNLPGLCTAGETYFANDAPAGANVQGCTAANTWTTQGTLTVKSDSLAVGTRQTVNFVTGTGLVTVITDDGTEVNVQTALDTSLTQTQIADQSGATLLCGSTGALTSHYQCSLSPTLTTYTLGMLLRWLPDVSGAGGATTLNVDTLGSVPIKLADGATDPGSSAIVGGRLYDIWYDGSVFRLTSVTTSGGGGGGAVSSVYGRTGSVTAQSGDYTTAQVTESGNLYFTNARAQSAMSGQYESPLTLSAPLSRTGNTISLPAAGSGQNGYLASADWATFNGKQAAISGAPGSWPSTFAPSAHAASHGSGQSDAVSLDTSQIATGIFNIARIPTGTSSTTVALGNHTHTPSQVGLGNVENTALSTWAGSANVTTLGTIATGAWHGTALADSYISSAATWSAKQSAITGAPGVWPPFGGAALLNVGTTAGTVAAGNDARFGSGGSVNVNGSSVSSPNLNGSTPAAQTGNMNATFQVSGSNVSVEIPATATPGANSIPVAGAGGTLAGGWIIAADAPAWQVCNPAGCGSETSNGYYAIMNPNGVTFDECGVNLATAGTGSSVIIDVQDSTGASIFGVTKLVVPTSNTAEVFQATFSGSPYTAAKGAKFRAVVTQNDSGGTAQFAYVRCRVH